MKKNLLIVALVIAFIAGLISCSKEADEQIVPATKKEKVLILTKGQSGLKSATITPDTVKNGDTINGVFNIANLYWAKRLNGQPMDGQWTVRLIQSDFGSDYSNSFCQDFAHGDQMATMFPEHGLYEITFGLFIDYSNTDVICRFYAKVGGTPGKIGDGPMNDFICRVEQKSLFSFGEQMNRDLLFIYFKYATQPEPGMAWCIMNYSVNGVNNWATLEAKRWPFGNNYYYIVIPAYHADYEVTFTRQAPGQQGYTLDVNNHRSSWSRNGEGIKFSL